MNLKSFFKKIIPEKYHSLIFKFIARLNHFKYLGRSVQCPCCNSWLKDYAPFYNNKLIVDRVCTKCLSFSRHRLLYLYLKNKTELFDLKNIKLLHTSPEECLEKIFKNIKSIEYTSIDISSGKAQIAMDLTNLSFPNQYFDIIISVHVLEHIEDDKKAMKELYRVLKPTGWAIIQVPIDDSKIATYEDKNITSYQDREKAFWQGDHVRIYGKDYIHRLTAAGFKVKADDYAKTLTEEIIQKHYLAQEELIFVCTKN